MIELSKSDTETILAERHPPTLIVMAPETEISMPQVRQKRLRRRSKRKSLSSRVVATTPHVEIPDAVGVCQSFWGAS